MVSTPSVALITGGCGRIGKAIAKRLAPEGHRIVLLDVSDAVHSAAQELKEMSIDARSVQIDIAESAEVQSLPDLLGDWWDHLSILVNNAGISPKTDGAKRQIIDMPVSEWNRVMAVNLTGTFLVTQTCLQTMRHQKSGRIIMIASQAARTRTVVPGAHYQASKAGMVGFARVLASEVAAYGITVNCVAPGRIESDMTAAVSDGTNSGLANTLPIPRMGTPEEVAAAVAYFASKEASYSTGAIIDVNGGSFMP